MSNILENRLEYLFNRLLEVGSVDELESEWDKLNRLEQYLLCIISRSGIERMGKPMNRLEVLLQAAYNTMPENSVSVLSARLEEQD
jgi:hypothetical protein